MSAPAPVRGPLAFDPTGLALTAEEREMLAHPLVGGVILFKHNYADPDQLRALIAACRSAHGSQLLVLVDHEGGRVQRFRHGFTALPPAAALGWLHQRDPVGARETAGAVGRVMARELAAVGVDVNLAPVADLQGGGAVIGSRALSPDPAVTAALAAALVRGLQAGGVGAVAKHFPGHGGVEEDTHTAQAVDPRAWDTVRGRDGAPFEHLVRTGVDGVLPAHVQFPAVDDRPVGFSRAWLQGVLRQQLGFAGLIISDDLSMAAAAMPGGIAASAEAALAAGCDLILSCQRPAAVVTLLDTLRDVGEAQARTHRVETLLQRCASRSAPVEPDDVSRISALNTAYQDAVPTP
ncbi:MAG: beta-N-acetylhexosaminidase [Pseudomonadota bacterium]